MSETKNTTKPTNKKKASAGPLSFLSSLCYIWWLETKSTIKDEGVLIFFLVVPLAYPLLYSWIYNNEVVREVPVAIVDLSHSSSSRELFKTLMRHLMYVLPTIVITCRRLKHW